MKTSFSAKEIGALLNVSRSTVNKWVLDGKLVAYQLPGGDNRVLREELLKFMDRYNIPHVLLDNPPKTRVLIVDDDEKLLTVISAYLDRAGDIEVRAVTDQYEGGIATHEFVPHIIVLDIALDGLDGREVSQQLHKYPQLKETKIIAISGRVSISKKEMAEYGFDAFLAKPFDEDELLACIRGFTGGEIPERPTIKSRLKLPQT